MNDLDLRLEVVALHSTSNISETVTVTDRGLVSKDNQ